MANKELKSIKFPGLADTYTVNSMPDGASANQQLVTDKEGVVKWEEKPFYHFQDTDIITWDNLQNKPFLDIDKTYLSVSDNLLSIKPELIENLQKVSADIINLKQLNTSLDTRLEIVEKSIEFKDF